MTNNERIARIKRVKPSSHGSDHLDSVPLCHILIEKTSRAISDWQSEMDWPVHTDQAIRAIEAIAEFLQREGHVNASKHLRSVICTEPRPRSTAASAQSRSA
jgi:hypothetical protein